MKTRDASLKTHWDNYSVLKTAKEEGINEGVSKREIEIAEKMKLYDETAEKIAVITGLTKEEIEKL